ncbi:MAG TPA: hypothetical protein VFO22_10955, partial [Candidatus Udaeobacter sp.]|nr:hypothetical protein [Candidatus Udaeobacter sp.]
MNTSEAKEKLLLYRGPIDDADPRFQEALAQARRDPELGEWLRDQASCYHVIRSKLRELEPPSDLAEKIMQNRSIPFVWNWKQTLELAAAIIISAAITAVSMKLWQHDRHRVIHGQEIVVKGEVLDLTCYVAYNWSGPEHAACARDCITSGLPVGIKTEDGKVYLLTGK